MRNFTMNKREVAELRKLLKPEGCSLTRICGCYVDGEKNIKASFANAFLSLPEESIYKYLEILKKGLSGTIGKTLYNLDFPLAEEKDENGTHSLLMKLRTSELKDSEAVQNFFQRVIDTYEYPSNYLILLVHNSYDEPGKTADGMSMDDASDEVFSYISCVVSPVDLTKPGLSYHETSGDFQECMRHWVAGQPEVGFVFPAFNDRSTDLHALLYYAKKEVHMELVEDLLKCSFSSTAEEQKGILQSVVEGTLGENCSFENVKSVISEIDQAAEEHADDQEPAEVGQSMMLSFLEDHIDNEEQFSESWNESGADNAQILLDNISSKGKCVFDMGDIKVTADNATGDMVELKEVNGRMCLVIPYDGNMTINGITIKD